MEYAPRQEKPKTTNKAMVLGKNNPDMLLSNLPYTPATDLSRQFNVVQGESESVLNAQSKEASDSIPVVKESEGSAFKSSLQKETKENNTESGTKEPDKTPRRYVIKDHIYSKEPEKKQSVSTDKSSSKSTNYYSVRPRISDSTLTENQAQNELEAIKLNTSSIPDHLQENTNVNLSGEASVENLSVEQGKTGEELQIRKNQASTDIHKDYGENDVLKKPSDHELKTTYKFQAVNFTVSPVEDFHVEGIDNSGINSEFKPVIESGIGTETEKYHSAQTEYDQRISEEENASEIHIDEEKNKSKESQLKTVKNTQTEVNKSRAEWQKELNKTETGFSEKAGSQAVTTMAGIRAEKTSGEAAAQSHIDKANADARREKEKAEREAEEKKSEKKKESKGFFGWVADKASAFINTLKKAVNIIFTKLREVVKAIFEAAKKLVLTVLEIARKAIVTLIKGFAAALKIFLDIALAAFPVIRDRFKARIDNFVATAERYVNQIFDLFKKSVTAILDFLASVIDAYLEVLQAVYNFILDAINFIVSGIIRIIEFLVNLGIAAGMSVFEFFGALGEEALGGNPANPIQDIEVPIGQEKAWSAAMGRESGEQYDNESVNAAIPVLTKPVLDDDDVMVEPYPAVTMDDAFMYSLPDMKDGEQYELGGAGENSITAKEFQESAAFSAGLSIPEDEQVSDGQEAGNQTENVPAPDWRNMDDEAKLNHYNQQMLVESEKTGNTEPTPEKITPEPSDDNSPEALITKTGRLSTGRRLAFMGEQMITGIRAFWNKYKGWIIAGLVVALVAIGAILFFSGGAALGAVVSAIGKALILIFGAIAVTRAMGSIWDYVTKTWDRDIKGASKALATAFAIIVTEFFIDKILFGMGKVFKRVLKAFKATKAGRFVRKAVVIARRGQRSTGRLVKQGIAKIRGTKLVITLEKITAKGANKLDDLRNKILTKFGFKRLWIEKHGKYTELWGEFNAKVLLMREDVDNGKVYKVDDIDDVGRVGSKYGKKGIVLDETGNTFSRNVELIGDQKTLEGIYQRLDDLSDAERLKKIQTGNPHASTRVDWNTHQTAVNNNLAKTHPNQMSAEQVTFDLYGKNGNYLTTIRADNAVIDGFGNVTIIDAKHQANAEIARGIKKPINTVTDNQLIGYPAIKDGSVGKVVPRGKGANDLEIIDKEIRINPRIEIHTNDINGDIIRMDLDGNIIN